MKIFIAVLFAVLFTGGWMVAAADGPYLPERVLIGSAMFGLIVPLAGVAERKGWLDETGTGERADDRDSGAPAVPDGEGAQADADGCQAVYPNG